MKSLLTILVALVTVFTSCETKHVCSDPTHRVCDGVCVCDGMECPAISEKVVVTITYPARDYQLEVVEDSLLLFDGNRLVGTVAFGTALGDIIAEDYD